MSTLKDSLRAEALEYHKNPPGKIAIQATKPMTTQKDLALAYSPGVAAPCLEIEKDPLKALDYTSRGNMVAVISNGTAVLGLGNIGALASKPVMEGKSVLFKKFADIDSIDIEIDETDVDKIVEIIASLEPSFGGINLEDIKAPECFEIEKRLKERMNIPVFHDDQHGTAIIVTAAFLNWLHLTGRDIKSTKLVANGAGASAIACLNLLVSAGLPKDNIIVCDRNGVIYEGRTEGMDPYKAAFANKTNARTLDDAMAEANVFLGLSAAGALSGENVKKMADAPLIMALSNPTPEIMPDEALKAKPNALICTGRSDFTNQVNNVLCFPFLFRGALDVGATAINEEMKLACVEAIAQLARKEASAEVASVYTDEDLTFGPEYLIPKPFDPRLIVELSLAVAQAAMDSGVATRPIKDMESYREKLTQSTYITQLLMRPIYEKARGDVKRVVFCEGEEERVLRAVQVIVDDHLAKPILVGRQSVVDMRIKKFGLRLEKDKDYTLVDPQDDPRYHSFWSEYFEIMKRQGVTPSAAKKVLYTNTTVIGALLVKMGHADAVICGTVGQFKRHMGHIRDVIGLKDGVETAAALSGLIVSKGTFFICDTQINPNPSVAQISEMTLLAAEKIRRFGIEPRIALLSHSNFGSHDDCQAKKMRAVYEDLRARAPDLNIDGEMQADCALNPDLRMELLPDSSLEGQANLLIMPDQSSANITYNVMKCISDGIPVGPLLIGAARPAHILTPAATTRGIINVTAIAAVEAQATKI